MPLPEASSTGEWMHLGVLTAPWGLRGEMKTHLDADLTIVDKLKRVYVGRDRRPYAVLGLFKRGRLYTLRLEGVDTIEDAERCRDLELTIPRTEMPRLPRGHYLVEQIVGLRAVTTEGRDLGAIAEVLPTGANDVYVVVGDAGEILVPAIRSVVRIDIDAGVVHITPTPGLLADEPDLPVDESGFLTAESDVRTGL